MKLPKLPRWLRWLLGLGVEKAIDAAEEALNAPRQPTMRPPPGPDVRPITDADRGRPPRTPAETPAAKARR